MRLSTLGAVGRSGRVGVRAAPSNGVITITQPADNQLTFTWTWDANGAAITSYYYTVTRVLTGFIAVSGSTTATNLTATNLAPESYTITLRATNSIGSTTITKTQVVIGRASVPRNLTYSVSSGNLTLYWAAPTDNGGSAITNYYGRIRNDTDGGSFPATFTALGDVLQYTWTSILNNKSYSVELYAVNANQTGYESTTATGLLSFVILPPTTTPVAYSYTMNGGGPPTTQFNFNSSPDNATSIVAYPCVFPGDVCYDGYTGSTINAGVTPGGANITSSLIIKLSGGTKYEYKAGIYTITAGSTCYNSGGPFDNYTVIVKFAYVNAGGQGPLSGAYLVKFTKSGNYTAILPDRVVNGSTVYGQQTNTMSLEWQQLYTAYLSRTPPLNVAPTPQEQAANYTIYNQTLCNTSSQLFGTPDCTKSFPQITSTRVSSTGTLL